MQVLKSNVLIEPIYESKTSAGVILVHDMENDAKVISGKVHAVGPAVEQVKVGDTVLYKRADTFKKIDHLNKECFIIKEEALLAIKE